MIRPVFSPFFLFMISALSAWLPGVAGAQDSVTWMEAIAPPFFIHEGELKGQGYEDVITDILMENMPQYSHKKITANISRHYRSVQNPGTRSIHLLFHSQFFHSAHRAGYQKREIC